MLVEGSRRLLAAEADAGVRHHVGISILGCDRVPLGYYRAKVAQEQAIAGGRIPWSLLRASQFHTLIATVFELWGRAHAVPTGKARLQPVDPRVVARRIADSVHEGPAGRLPDVAGPEIGTLTELAGAWRRHHGRRLLPVRLPMAGPIGRPLREAALCDPAAAAGGTTFEEWVAAR